MSDSAHASSVIGFWGVRTERKLASLPGISKTLGSRSASIKLAKPDGHTCWRA